MTAVERRLRWEHLLNARDLGGLPTRRGWTRGVAAILHDIADAPPGGILVHCHAGKDRTGVVVALLLSIAGVDREAIAEDYALSIGWNENVQNEEEIMVAPDAEERLRQRRIYYPRPENMLQMLAEVDRRHGGVDPYLDGIGVGSGVRERLRQRLA